MKKVKIAIAPNVYPDIIEMDKFGLESGCLFLIDDKGELVKAYAKGSWLTAEVQKDEQ